MPVTISDVLAAYRAFLGREPESIEAVAEHLSAGSLTNLRNVFLNSDEFRAEHPSFPVGLHTEVDRVHVEVDASEEQLARMLDRTAAAWRAFGKTEPHWSVLTDRHFLADRIEETKDHFYLTGKSQVSSVMAMLKRNNIAIDKNGSSIDFGCGVGRLTLALSDYFRLSIGVDVSANHIAHARDRQRSEGITNAKFLQIDKIADIGELSRCDFLLTLIVLQHNPPPIIKAILERLLSLVNPGGVAVFQVPTFKANYQFSVAEYLALPPSSEMEMHPLPQPHIYELLRRQSFDLIEVREDIMPGDRNIISQTFLARKSGG